MITSKFLSIFALSSVVYFILYLLLDDAPLYLIGGGLGAILKSSGKQTNTMLLVFSWIILLAASIFGYFKIGNNPVKYFFLLLIIVLFYVIAFILYNLLNFETTDIKMRYINVGLMILAKSIILSLLIYLRINYGITKAAH